MAKTKKTKFQKWCNKNYDRNNLMFWCFIFGFIAGYNWHWLQAAGWL